MAIALSTTGRSNSRTHVGNGEAPIMSRWLASPGGTGRSYTLRRMLRLSGGGVTVQGAPEAVSLQAQPA